MLPYWTLFGTFSLGAFLRTYRPPKPSRRNVLLLICILVAILFVGLRYEVGADWDPYSEIFQRTRKQELQEVFNYGDPAFYLVVWLVHRLNLEIWALNIVCATIFIGGLLAFARRQPNPWLTVAVTVPYLVIVVGMSGTRQATAIGLVFLALNAYSDRNMGRASLWIALAATFHASAIVMIGVLALSYTRNRLVGVVVLLLALLLGQIFFLSTFEVYVDRYSDEEVQSEGTIYRILMNLIPSVIYLRWARQFDPDEHNRSMWRNLSLLALAALPALMLVPSSTALDRLSLYLAPLQAYVLGKAPSTIAASQQEQRLLVLAILGYLFAVMFVWLNFASHSNAWLPYRMYPFS